MKHIVIIIIIIIFPEFRSCFKDSRILVVSKHHRPTRPSIPIAVSSQALSYGRMANQQLEVAVEGDSQLPWIISGPLHERLKPHSSDLLGSLHKLQ